MTWLISFFVALITAAVGCIGAGLLAERCVRWYRISSFEGGSGYFVIGLALLGLVLGFVMGLVVARLVAAETELNFLHQLSWSVGVASAVLLVATAAARLAADPAPTLHGRPLYVEVELVSPVGAPVPACDENARPYLTVENFRREHQPSNWITFDDVRHDDGRWIVTATTPLDTRAARKLLHVHLAPDNDLYFAFSVPSQPREKHLQWSPWLEAAHEPTKPRPADPFRLRYRIQVEPPPSPPLSSEELAANEAARQDAAFAALDPNGPLQPWLPFLDDWTRPQDRAKALAMLGERPDLVSSLSELMEHEDAETAALALRAVAAFPDLQVQLAPSVTHAGHDLAQRIRHFNATTPEEDPSYLGAADASIRFNGWMRAVRCLREGQHADLIPELRAILQAARERPDSQALRHDIVRVASFYLQEWAGDLPHPNDPAPR